MSFSEWSKLRKYNLALGVAHAILAIGMYFYFRRLKDKSTVVEGINLELFDHKLQSNTDSDGKIVSFDVLCERVVEVSEGSVTNMIVSFFALTAAFHFFYALDPCGVYTNAVRSGNNYFRWIEYAISATIMVVVIALLSGVKNVKNYVLLIGSAVAMILTGQWFETVDGNQRLVALFAGFILLAAIFWTIGTSFAERLQDAKDAGGEVPSWLWAVVVVMFIFYSSFGFVPVAQVLRPADYERSEYTYLTLSLLSKASLGLLVGFGFGQRSVSDEAS